MHRLEVICLAAVLCLSHAYEFELDIVDPSTLRPGSRIIGGTATAIERFPYTVQVAQNSQLICGGSLITRRHVLSAAHCFVNERGVVANANIFSIRAGTSNLNTGGQRRRVSAIIVHEAYNRVTLDADVAVLLLASSLTTGTHIQPAVLPVQGFSLPDNSALTHVGWGHTSVNGSLSPVLQEVTVHKVNFTECATRYARLMQVTGHIFTVTRNMICAGLLDIGGADACQGDSGGPLISNYNRTVVVGVTSWGYECATPDFPGVSARVSNFTNWIEATVQRYNGAPSLSLVNTVVLFASLLASLTVFKDV